MRWLDRCGDDAETVSSIQALLVNGRHAAAVRAAEGAARSVANPFAAAALHINRVCGLLNLGRTTEYTAALDQAFAAIREMSEPYPHGHLHAVAALAARAQGAPERSLTHLVHASRALGMVPDAVDADLAWAWHDLATAYSYLGFHGYALTAIERARRLADAASVPPEQFAQPGIRLRMALSLDHHGDTDACLRVLRDLSGELGQYQTDRLRPNGRVGYGYALARLAALGEASAVPPRPLLTAVAEGQSPRDMLTLGEVCLMIAAGKATDSLDRLDTITVSPDSLGPAEHARLRSMSFTLAGDPVAAHQADRHAFRLAAQRSDRLREVFLEGVAARLDHEDVRRAVAKHGGEVLTDPLTGLPNRRHLERYVTALVGRGERAMVGTVDLDGLAAVNGAHGRLSGDLVLQRVGGLIARLLRRGDFVARSDSDEFVVVLTGASKEQAADVARRISGAVAAEEWESLVPGTRIGVTITWTSVPG